MSTTQFTFGYDIENVQLVEKHVVENYSENEYKMFVGRGDDVMNALEISVKKDDEELLELITGCDGRGEYEE